jgi:hypothetical protein
MITEAAPQIAVYYFANYHQDARNAQVHGAGWTEWELTKAAQPRWPGHAQPKVPLWGYTDEADPAQMAKKIDAAADHGIDAFIFDWYWYNDGPYLQRALDEGFLGAANRERLKFALMWANHDWTDIHPKKLKESPRLLYPGAVTRETFDTLVRHVIARYFKEPNYWRIEGRPYFSLYDLPQLINGLGGLTQTAAALRDFRERTRAAGHPDLHLNLVLWQHGILEGEKPIPVDREMVRLLGFDSITSYVWVHHVKMETFPETPYLGALPSMLNYTEEISTKFSPLPYYPNVTMGWDSSPRTVQTDRFENTGYPFTPSYADNTPANFKTALTAMRQWLATRPPQERILTINAWNEWTEGSYLEPDTRHGYGYLEAIRDTIRPAR